MSLQTKHVVCCQKRSEYNLDLGLDRSGFGLGLNYKASELQLQNYKLKTERLWSRNNMSNKKLEIIRLLLQKGADPNLLNRWKDTPLNIAIRNGSRNLEAIEEMLKCGADINIRNNIGTTPLDNAINDLSCAKLLIKYALVKNFGKDYVKIVDLSPYKESAHYEQLSLYLNKCIHELVQMKIIVSGGLSLGQFINTENPSVALYPDNKSTKCITDQMKRMTNYPIYNEMISPKITHALKRGSLLSKLHDLNVYKKLNAWNEGSKGKIIFLNYVSISNIAKYLFDEDLLNFIKAFDDSREHGIRPVSLNNDATVKVQHKVKCDGTFETSAAKRARLS